MSDIPDSHPRATSLRIRNNIVQGVELGITSSHGLIAHGRGEAFDYLLGEKTHPFAHDAIKAAASLLKSARHPVLSVNGNACALVAKELIELSRLLSAPLEINIFHASVEREKKMKEYLVSLGAKHVLLPQESVLPFLESNRRFVNSKGIALADVVFVPLEDGDRCEALIKAGKKVITIDLNPLSRTAQSATITIVDNVVRAMPLLITEISSKKSKNQVSVYSNQQMLSDALSTIIHLKMPTQ